MQLGGPHHIVSCLTELIYHGLLDVFVGQDIHPVAASWNMVNSEESDAAA